MERQIDKLATGIQIRLARARGVPIVHFLHIGKTGGTALKQMLAGQRPAAYRLVLHQHRFSLADVPRGDKVVLFVRDPVARYVSGFWSRERQGMPHYHNPWSPTEAAAFAEFHTPNELAIGLADPDVDRRSRAERAMRGIRHVADHYSNWLVDPAYLRSRSADILFIGSTERLAVDARRLAALLGLPELTLPTDDIAAHRRPSHQGGELEPKAVETLREWYAADYALMDVCREFLDAPVPANESRPRVTNEADEGMA